LLVSSGERREKWQSPRTNPQPHYQPSRRIAGSSCRPLSGEGTPLSLATWALPTGSRPSARPSGQSRKTRSTETSIVLALDIH